MERRGFIYATVAGFFGGVAAVFLFNLLFGDGGAVSWISLTLGLLGVAAAISIQSRSR